MITRAEAEQIAAQVAGPAAQGDGRGWTLVEFDAGWLIRPASLDDPALRGGGVQVVEQESGRVMRFPSSVSPDRILAHYDQVVHRGFPVDRT